jgi:hypothetical protein
VLDVKDRLVEQVSTRSWWDTAEPSIATASASSFTVHGASRSRASIRTRLGAASACIVSATCCAVSESMTAGRLCP